MPRTTAFSLVTAKAFLVLLTIVLSLILSGCDSPEPAESVKTSSPQATSVEAVKEQPDDLDDDVSADPQWIFPQRRVVDGGELTLHVPQVRSWPHFEKIDTQVVFEYQPKGETKTQLGTAIISGDTQVDTTQRTVSISNIDVKEVKFVDSVPDSYTQAVKNMSTREQLEVPVDIFLSYFAAEALKLPQPQGFNNSPPTIFYSSTPSILLFVNGEVVLDALGDSGLSVVVNANWPTFKDASGNFYLLRRTYWLQAQSLAGPWSAANKLPAAFSQLPQDTLQADIASAIPLQPNSSPAPKVIYSDSIAELIVTIGQPTLERIPQTEDLRYVTNTTSPLFEVEGVWYYLAAGRWFSTTQLNSPGWQPVESLPDSFSHIPTDHKWAEVRSSVPGTMDAKYAALEASIPVQNKVIIGTSAPDIVYSGEPKFTAIDSTKINRAVNTSYDVLEYLGDYYLCYSGAWYVASSPNGPWVLTDTIPAVFYDIPANSPSYRVTHVKVHTSTPSHIIYWYPPAYVSNVYIYGGIPVYGTGWYYPPYAYGVYYYPYYSSYGHGTWYNSRTGGYGSRSTVYGPYGGYSYSQGYNPKSGRYGYAETAWDHDEWASYSETYNPRTGVSSKASRYFDDDHNKMATNREVSKGGNTVNMSRSVDYDDRAAQTQRQFSNGASSISNKQIQNGTLSGDATITRANGDVVSINNSQSREAGSVTIDSSAGGSGNITRTTTSKGGSREGQFEVGGNSVTTQTERRGSNSVSKLESSSGVQGVSSSKGSGRTTIGKDQSGDLYAGRDGNVFKKTDSGWSKYNKGGWQEYTPPKRPELRTQGVKPLKPSGGANQDQYKSLGKIVESYPSTTSKRGNLSKPSRSSLNRDYNSRRQGMERFSQRRSNNFQRGQRRGNARGNLRGRR